ncbi:MAG: inositol monophosphatase [Dehalococcoidia bacterium]|nr:inositol monophosphatase [Dehalococcoidia bacterium]
MELPLSASGTTTVELARTCTRAGAALALERFRGAHTIGSKGRGNVVTETDLEVELRIKALLADEFPQHAVLSEETAAATDPSSGWVWVIDPIDGTKNYSLGIPFWCTTVALCRDGQPVAGCTYDALHDEEFWAVAAGGAWRNGARIRASDGPDVASSVIGVDLGYDDALGAAQIALMRRIFPRVQTMRILGSAALGIAYAASGRLDLFTHTNVYPWDIAAGILLVREAGGVATDRRTGEPMHLGSRAFVAGGRRVHDDFVRRYSSEQGGEPGATPG